MFAWLSGLAASSAAHAIATALALTAAHPLTADAPTLTAPAPFQRELPPLAERLRGPASRSAELSPAACKAELKRKDTNRAFTPVRDSRGIAHAVRVTGPIGKITWRVPAPKYAYGYLDCRLALLLLELGPRLEELGVTGARVDGFYRPGARLPGKKGKKSQHAYGLAIDLTELTVRHPKTGELVKLDVPSDFRGQPGEPVCGEGAALHLPPEASAEESERALLLRNLVCELARGGWFHHILTPNHDRAHESHLHLDIQRGCRFLSID